MRQNPVISRRTIFPLNLFGGHTAAAAITESEETIVQDNAYSTGAKVYVKQPDVPGNDRHRGITGNAQYFVGAAEGTRSYPLRGIDFVPVADETNRILRESGLPAYQFIRQYISPAANACLLPGDLNAQLSAISGEYFDQIINLKRINDIRRINKFFETVNRSLNRGGIFIGKVEIYLQKKKKIMAAYPRGINTVVYALYYLVNRVVPKLPYTKQLYYITTRGNNRVLSKAETYGRLYSCGFEVIGEIALNGFNYFACRKVKEPAYDTHPTYGMFIRLKRVGKGGALFNVYKLRTMHAYSEYLQQYVYEKCSLDDGGKFRDDFRVTTVGKVIRKFWLDELPMFINVLVKRNMKLVGVRPLSEHYFSLYSEELKAKRIRYKPGLIPPYYAQYPTPKTLEEVQQNEMEYLRAYEKNPLITDLRYLCKALGNIIFRCARSK